MRIQRGCMALLVVLACGWQTTAAAQVATVPVSPQAVTLSVSTSDGRSASMKVLNGGLVRLSIDEGPTLGITPLLNGEQVELVFFEVLQDASGDSYGLRQLDGRLRLDRGVPQQRTWQTMVVKLAWDGVEPVSEEQFRRCVSRSEAPRSAHNAELGEPDGPCVECCATCGGIRGCGCAVVMECGSCCCPDACTCP